ncbi:hypothetical protein ABVK25_010747 [Lepraria finkii]|uniref:Uncharacterized protein n=1 Tax=Lepraria finkii TaxID=1340010 RepID=A0ABR4ATG0_9LECA
MNDVFVQFGLLKTKPANNAAGSGLPTFRCLENYAAYYVHMPGHDGKENTSAALAAVHYDSKLSNGQYYPSLMFALDSNRQPK